MTATIDRERLAALKAREDEAFVARHPRSRELFERAQAHMLDGVPMNWMTRWSSPFPPFVAEAHGARFTCVDGHEYVDFCLGDTGAMTGHSPEGPAAAIAAQAARGITTMLPTEDSLWVADELSRRFGLRYWQLALTATDANRFAVRLARHVTRRPKILVYNYCYHGSVDETIITINDGVPGPKPGNAGPPVDPTVTTKVIEWNDLEALERALEPGDVACVLAEPALTNIGIILPDDGYHDGAAPADARDRHAAGHRRDAHHLRGPRRLHSGVGPRAGHGDARQAHRQRRPRGGLRLRPGDRRPHPRGLGLSRRRRVRHRRHPGRQHAERRCCAGDAERGAHRRGVRAHDPARRPLGRRRAAVIDEFALPWVVKRLGCRAEYWPRPVPPRNGGEAAAAEDEELDRYLHLFMLNRGILMTPFHNMALMCAADHRG